MLTQIGFSPKMFPFNSVNDFSVIHYSEPRSNKITKKPCVMTDRCRRRTLSLLWPVRQRFPQEWIMNAFTFYLETRQMVLIPIKSLFFSGVAIIISDLPIIFLIFPLILSPRCVWLAL